MNEYEKYQLQWLMEHGYSLADFVKALIPYANEVSSIDVNANLEYCVKEGFYDFKNEGFDGDIWLGAEEWKQEINKGNDYNLTDAGKTKVKHFIENCRIKQDSILKAGLDTAKETTLPSVEDILCNVEDMVDKNGEYTNAWSISDNYLSDPLELHKDEDFVIISNERTKDNPMNEHLIVKEEPAEERNETEEVQTNMGSMPIEDYREIVASQSGFDSYDEMYHQGYRIGNGYDKEPEPVVPTWEQKKKVKGFDLHPDVPMADRHTFNLRENEVETVGKKEHFRRNIMAIQLLKKCGLSDYTKNSQIVERPDWMEEYEVLIDRDNDYVLLRDPNENVNQVWTASGEFLSTVQLENETVDDAMEEYYYNISKGDIEL